jgi:hypothetical protein
MAPSSRETQGKRKMKKSELRASKDSQGFYEVRQGQYGSIVWDGFATSANEAKDNAIEWADEEQTKEGFYWCDRDIEWKPV